MGTRQKTYDTLHTGESFAAVGDFLVHHDFGRTQRDKTIAAEVGWIAGEMRKVLLS